ncbi:MAG: alpha/beta fold hydrolase, partial [Anaerolineaceae bacterium]|nr:alpha/beta fold hydrolase [Anaerolineaceae bacterium]
GFTISAPLLPGHGTHPKDLNRVSWRDWVDCGEKYLAELQKRCSRILVGGESMGALVALHLAANHPEIDAVTVAAPALEVSGMNLASLIAPFKKWLVKPVKEDGLAWKGYNVYPLKGAVEFYKFQKVVKKTLQKITQPILMFTGGLDATITPGCADLLLNHVSSKVKIHHKMQDSSHCIYLDKENEQVCKITKAFYLENCA